MLLPHVHPAPAVLLGIAPQLEALAPLPSAGHNGHSGLLPSLGSAVRHPGKPFLKSWGPRWRRKPMSETTLGLLRTGQEWLEGSWSRQREQHESESWGRRDSSCVQVTEMKASGTRIHRAREWSMKGGRRGRDKH